MIPEFDSAICQLRQVEQNFENYIKQLISENKELKDRIEKFNTLHVQLTQELESTKEQLNKLKSDNSKVSCPE